jgi:hypothetical protein
MMHPPTIYTDGRSTTLSGNITLKAYTSDKYTIALPYKLNSAIKVRYEAPLMSFNEVTSFFLMIPYLILIAIFTIAIVMIRRTRIRQIEEPTFNN